ncbi:MAG: C69 family dipeptidase [Bulleidia sp.]
MPCTTLIVGRKASYNGSTMIARNDDSPAGKFAACRFEVVKPEDQPRHYQSVISHVKVELPDNPMRYTAMPDVSGHEGIWAAAGVNAANVGMTATETITSNVRVLSADPLVRLTPARDGKEEVPGGIGEEDIVVLVLPYIHSAREGVLRLGSLLEQYGTYESNGIAFHDADEVWWLESVGGHHWIARKLPEDSYAVLPNQFCMDTFDLNDAFGKQENYLCSSDLREFIAENHLDLSMDGIFNARVSFGSHSDSDHVYNTPRAWIGQKYFNPNADWSAFGPESDDLPWCRVPEHKITPEDVKYVLSNHFQGTEYDPYEHLEGKQGKYRPIGISRTTFMSCTEIRPDHPAETAALEWVCYGSNVFNAFVPFFTQTDSVPEYLGNTTKTVSTDNFYWASRLIGALADSQYHACVQTIERYQAKTAIQGRILIQKYEKLAEASDHPEQILKEANDEIAAMTKKETDAALNEVLYLVSCRMRNSYSRSDQ